MKIISFKICPFVQRVTALLEATNTPYDIEYIDLSHKPQWFLDISPNAQVPVLVTDDDQVLFESDAITEYVDEVIANSLSRTDPVEKAQDRAWSYLAAKNYLVQCSAQRSPNAEQLQERGEKLSAAFSKMEKRLGDAKFVNGDELGMIDIAWLPLLHRAHIVAQESGYDFLANFPKLKNLQINLLATGIAEKSVPRDFDERFASFYLSESTHLGEMAQEKNGMGCAAEAECRVDDLSCCA
ncbi:MAG: glutathione S-transferase family protein [Pseudomonadota bacterium]